MVEKQQQSFLLDLSAFWLVFYVFISYNTILCLSVAGQRDEALVKYAMLAEIGLGVAQHNAAHLCEVNISHVSPTVSDSFILC